MARHIMKMDWKALGYQAKYEIIDNNITVIWENMTAISEAKSAAVEEMNSEQFDREFDLEQIVRVIKEEDAELLERLSDD